MSALEIWEQKEDFRFTDKILASARSHPDYGSHVERTRASLQRTRNILREEIKKVQDAIEQEVINGILDEEGRSKYSAQIAAINPQEVLQFSPVKQTLNSVRVSLEKERNRRLQTVQEEWLLLRLRLAESINVEQFQHTCAFVDAAIERQDTRIADECLARLTQVLEEDREFRDDWFKPVEQRDWLQQYLSSAQQTLSNGTPRLPEIIQSIRNGAGVVGLPFDVSTEAERRYAVDVLEAWSRLKQTRTRDPKTDNLIAQILTFLGFTAVPGHGTMVRGEPRGDEALYVRTTMSAGDQARPIPQFGSLAQQNYDLVCLWESQTSQSIVTRLQKLDNLPRTTILFYLGRLSFNQRSDLLNISRQYGLTLVVLDEILLLFLAAQSQDRISAFLHCALPFTRCNPYMPFQAGDVPNEMFFGRDEMATELMRPAGSCLVYGGRQLGKSALLRYVQRQFQKQGKHYYAWVSDIKSVGDPLSGQPTDAIWRRLHEGFIQMKLLERGTAGNPETILRQVRRAMNQPEAPHVLMMFDEADNFLDADDKSNFEWVTELRGLMQDTGRRFKVVFAGLHIVQRFQFRPNQPLAHFGRPVLVGPLEPDAARQLICEPFQTLGYRFVDEAAVLRILSYTNYHPGLIQLFCQELLKQQQKRGGGGLPPCSITREDVEAVYRLRDEVRERIAERFNWTLALDTRYQAIAWAIIQDHIENANSDSYGEAYLPDEILSLARQHWAEGFKDVDSNSLRGLLAELCGLGVLVRQSEGKYRLRSPNLVRIMGTEDYIATQLLELSDRGANVEYDRNSLRACLEETQGIYSPLTYVQEDLLNLPHPLVGLVFGSEASGISKMPLALKRFVSDLPSDVAAESLELPEGVRDETAMFHWLSETARSYAKHERLVVYQNVTNMSSDQEGKIRAALRFCHGRKDSRQLLQVIFIFDTRATWEWMNYPAGIRLFLENRAHALTSLQRWSLDGIRQRLEQQGEKLRTDDICHRVLQVTGGWPYLIDELFTHCGMEDDPRPAVNALERTLNDSASEQRREWQRLFGLGTNTLPWRVFGVLKTVGKASSQDLLEVILGEMEIVREEGLRVIEYLRRTGCILDLSNNQIEADPIVGRILTF